jgi:hypothetical protein
LKAVVKCSPNAHRLNKDLNLGLVAVLAEALEYPDVRLVLHLLEGMQVCGDLTYDSGVYRFSPPEEKLELFQERFDKFEDGHEEWFQENKKTLTEQAHKNLRLAAAGGPLAGERLKNLQAVHRATEVEVVKGLMGRSMSEADLRKKYAVNGRLTCRVIPRFPVLQGMTKKRCKNCDTKGDPCAACQGFEMRKLRCCDDATKCGTNSHSRTRESVVCPTFEYPARVAAAFMQKTAGSRQELILGLEDLFAAYRRVPGKDGSFSVVAVYDFIRKELMYYDVFGLNFCLASAPLQFNRVAEFLVTSCKCIFGACVQHYYDNFMIVDVARQPIHDFDELAENGESRVWASSVQWALNKLCTEVCF